MEHFTVTIRTTCRACALAIAGHASAMAKADVVMATAGVDTKTTIFQVGPGLAIDAQWPLCCPEHGGIVDTRVEGEPGNLAEVIQVWPVVSDPRTGDGGGRTIAMARTQQAAQEIATAIGGVAGGPLPGVRMSGGTVMALDTRFPVHESAREYALAQVDPRWRALLRA